MSFVCYLLSERLCFRRKDCVINKRLKISFLFVTVMFSSRLASQTFRASRNIARPSSTSTLSGALRSHRLPGAISHAQLWSSGSQRAFSNTRIVLTNSSNAPASSPPSLQSQSTEIESAVKQNDEPRLSLTFTCTVPDCGERSTHQFTKRAYERGIVLIECPKCKNRCVFQISYNTIVLYPMNSLYASC